MVSSLLNVELPTIALGSEAPIHIKTCKVPFDIFEGLPDHFNPKYAEFGISGDFEPFFRIFGEGSLVEAFADSTDINIRLKSPGKPINLLVLQRTWNEAETSYKLSPRQLPIVLESQSMSSRVTFQCLNAPVATFGKECWKLKYQNFEIVLNFHRALTEEPQHNKILNCQVSFERVDQNCSISFDDAIEVHRLITDMLSFIKGSLVGSGQLFGAGSDGLYNIALLGFNRSDLIDRYSWWENHSELSQPQNLLDCFAALSQDSDLKGTFDEIFTFYRASNALRPTSLEMALIASYSALEVATNSLLSSSAGWTGELIKSRIPFHEKLRAALAWIGLEADIFGADDLLRNKANSMKVTDAAHLLSQFRNSIVHSGSKVQYEGLEIHCAWQLSQWICEMFMFRLLKYTGQYRDRREIGGWKGTTYNIPPLR